MSNLRYPLSWAITTPWTMSPSVHFFPVASQPHVSKELPSIFGTSPILGAALLILAILGSSLSAFAEGEIATVSVAAAKQEVSNKPISEKQIQQLIQQLADPVFETREKAAKQLVDLGEEATSALRKALDDTKDLEARRRMDAILQAIEAAVFKSAELHVVSVHTPCEEKDGLLKNSEVVVHVLKSDKPYILVLTAYKSATWRLKIDDKAKVVRVIVSGHEKQQCVGIKCPVQYLTYEQSVPDQPRYKNYFHAYCRDDKSYTDLITKVENLTGKTPATFQGQGVYNQRPFVVPGTPPWVVPPINAAVHVLAVATAGINSFEQEDLPKGKGPELAKLLAGSAFNTVPSAAKRFVECLPTTVAEMLRDEKRRAALFLRPDEFKSRDEFKRASLDRQQLFESINYVLQRADLYNQESFQVAKLTDEGKSLVARHSQLSYLEQLRLNRLLLEAAFPTAITPKATKDWVPGTASVFVDDNKRPVVLVLAAGTPIQWTISTSKRTKVERVVLCGEGAQEVRGINAPVFDLTAWNGCRMDGRSLPFVPFGKEHPDHEASISRLDTLTTLKTSSFKAIREYDGQQVELRFPRP